LVRRARRSIADNPSRSPPTTAMPCSRSCATSARSNDPRPGVQQIVRLAALRRGTGKQVDIPAYQLGRIERRIVTIVTTEDDDVVVGVSVEQPQRLLQIGDKR